MKNSLTTLKKIVQKVATAPTPDQQTATLVMEIQAAMKVDVCSLYLAAGVDELVLAATQGLASGSVGKVRMKIGVGLVGTTALTRHPLNVENALTHEKYRYFPETGEESYRGFMCVPLINMRHLVGVLVVQQKRRRKFTDDEEAFLITMAAQLAGISQQIVAQQGLGTAPARLSAVKRVAGVRGAAGIGIGKLHLIADGGFGTVPDCKTDNIDLEITAFREALRLTRHELGEGAASLSASLPGDVAEIFTLYSMLLDNSNLTGDIEMEIRQGNWAPGAIRSVVDKYASQFESMEDPYFRARGEDIRNIGGKLYHKLAGKTFVPTATTDLILVGDLISITDLARYPTEQVVGIVCTSGSALSHTAVLANALGIAAVMGTGEIKGLEEGAPAIVDGYQGEVVFDAPDALVAEYRGVRDRERNLLRELEHLKDEPAVTLDGVSIRLYTNTGLMADISPGLLRGAQGVGLYRSEIPFMVHDNFPTEDEQCAVYRHVLEAYRDKPVYIRTLDIGGDKALPYYSFKEENPCLGWRGIRFTLDNAAIFMTQVRAMLRASVGIDNLHILLPMVSRVDEVTSFREILLDALGQLQAEGYRVAVPRIGIMVEVPGAITLLPFLARRIDFISIGSNDLAQYLLAVDRNNPRVSGMFDNLHPAVLHQVHHIIRTARHLDLPVSLCGEMAADPLAALLLVGMGIDTLSMSAYNLPRIKWLIRSISFEDAATILEKALMLEHEKEIRSMVKSELVARGLGNIVALA